jgi:hypothetical protein
VDYIDAVTAIGFARRLEELRRLELQTLLANGAGGAIEHA